MKQTIILLVTILAICVAFVIILFATSNNPTEGRQSFNRNIPLEYLNKVNELDLKFDSYYVAGSDDEGLYLGNLMAPLHILRTNLALTDTQHLQVRLDKGLKLTRNCKLKIDAPYFYLTDGIMPTILTGRIGEWKASHFMYDSAFFFDAIPISHSSFAIRALGSNPRENVLGRIRKGAPHLAIDYEILEKQVDGLFCTEGKLHYSKSLSELVYIYTYRNQYIILDTLLRVKARANTIDTFTHAQIKPADLESDNTTHTLSSPYSIINKKNIVYDKHLFVQSSLLSNNEDNKLFNHSSVIDVYGLLSKKYLFSFYIPDLNDTKMKSFYIYNDRVIAMYEHQLITYDLSPLKHDFEK